jgi:hypothetical protein
MDSDTLARRFFVGLAIVLTLIALAYLLSS